MTMQSAASDLVRRLQSSWPEWLEPMFAGEDSTPAASHPLSDEFQGLLNGKPASLPYFPPETPDVAWITLAPDSEALRSAYRDLRAWLLPSVGWDDPRGAFVPQGSSRNALVDTLSPSGYLRWRTSRDSAAIRTILSRLRTARELSETRPERLDERVPSLLELRQRFAVALVSGDRPSAEQAIETIDRHRLDTASNAIFLSVRLWDHFGDPTRIVEMPELEHLLHIRLPHRVCVAICRAFHTTRLAVHEDDAELSQTCRIFSDLLDTLIGQLVQRCGPDDGPELRRMRGYRAWKTRDPEAARAILAEAEDAPLQALLGPLIQSAASQAPQETLEERFFEARKQQDWRAVQELGDLLLSANPEVMPILRKSLQLWPNPELEARLSDLAETSSPAIALVPPVASTITLPQTWSEWLLQIPSGNPEALELFLENHERIFFATLRADELQPIIDALFEILTSPSENWPTANERIYNIGLVELIGECLNDPVSPHPSLFEVYRLLAQAWDRSRRGSAFLPDAQVLLGIADALMQVGPGEELLASTLIEAWWLARPVKAQLPY